MKEHQAGQIDSLLEVRVETQRSSVSRQPKASCRHFKCVVALAVMGFIIVVLVAGFIYHYFTSCNQEASPVTKIQMTCKLKKSAKEGRYDIFTANKSASYLFYGSVVMPNASKESVSLRLMHANSSSEIKPMMINETVIFFVDKAKLSNNTEISFFSKSAPTDSSFHVYEL